MEIYYIHKITGAKVSLQQLKDNTTRFFSFGKIEKGEPLPTKYEYGAMAIPLSDDFEIKCITTDFTAEELEKILFYIHSSTNRDNMLFDKIHNMWRKKRIHTQGE